MGYRYSTQGYYTLNEVSYNKMEGREIITSDGIIRDNESLSNYYNLNYSKKDVFKLI